MTVPVFDLSGRIALVTGASSGFGAHFARLLAAAGARVVVGARRIDRLEALCAEITASGGEALAVPLDVAGEASTIAAYDAAEARFGTVDTIVANAGIAADKLSAQIPIDEWDGVFATNMRGAFLTVREGARRLIAAGSSEKENGRVVVIGSITADKLYPGTAAYSASKAGVRHMARVLAREWARKGININVIQPGYFPTELTGDLFETEMGQGLLKTFPRRRLCEMDSLSVPLLHLCSDHARGVTGSVFTIDDGQSL
ncbi:MAG: SDR family NAD(P)-dependent oxidoreductase [Novosphingobium sp.]|nr:SDR family NAD(P)-dependent oxidoreductase [Novosphingobium sp.]